MLVLSAYHHVSKKSGRTAIGALLQILTGFECDIVIAIVNYPSDEGNVRSIDRVCAISIEIVAVVVVLEIRVVDVDVL